MNPMRSEAVMGLVVAALCFVSGSAAAGDGFADDVAFMKKHTQIVLLQDGDAAVAVAPAYQGRVMTSTFDRNGRSELRLDQPPGHRKRTAFGRREEGQARRAYLYLRRRGTILARTGRRAVCLVFQAGIKV